MALYIGEEVIGKVIVGTQSSGGTDTSDATLTNGAQMLAPYTAYSKGTKYTGTITTRSSTSVTASGATVSVPAGYYPSAVSKSVATTTVASPSVSISTSTGLVTATQNQSAGYVSADTTTGTLQLSTQAAKTVTPGSSQQTAVAAGKYTTGAVTVAAVSTSSPTFTSNGTYTPDPGEYFDEVTVEVSGGGTINNQNKTVNPTESQQSVTADAGYTGLGTVTVNAISSTYVGSDVPQRDSSDLTVSGPTVSVPSGYYADNETKSVSNGSVTAPSTISGTSASLTTGNNTITLTKTVSVTPSVTTAGYVSNGTAGNSSVFLTASVTTKSAATYNASSSDQTISSGQYLTGTQTIKGVTVSGLSSNTILSGTTVKIGDANDDDRIASVSGSVTFQTYYTGSSAPSSSLGVDGDIYLRTS